MDTENKETNEEKDVLLDKDNSGKDIIEQETSTENLSKETEVTETEKITISAEQLTQETTNQQNVVEEEELVEESIESNPEVLQNDSDILNDDEDEDYDYAPSKGDNIKTGLLWIGLVIVILGLIALFYRFYPLTSKVSGTWTASTTTGVFKVTNDGKTSTFIMENLNGTEGMDMVFQSELAPKAENEYVGKNTQVFIELDRELFTDEMVNQMIGDSSLLKHAIQTDKVTRLKYTKKGIKQAFPDQDLDKMFKYVLKDFNWKMQGETLSLINGSFAQGGVPMSRE